MKENNQGKNWKKTKKIKKFKRIKTKTGYKIK